MSLSLEQEKRVFGFWAPAVWASFFFLARSLPRARDANKWADGKMKLRGREFASAV